ncbi:MAG: hypothetical protein Kow0069_01270 [Promethearchaeota archaeon]
MPPPFECMRCGACCQDLPRIPIFPEETDRLIEIAKERGIALHVVEDLVFPDVKRQKILVVTYRIMFDNPAKTCPFYDHDLPGCAVHPDRPASCRAYPLAIKTEDAFTSKVEIGSFCTWTQKYREELERLQAKDLQAVFGGLVSNARALLARNNEIRVRIRVLQQRGVIDVPSRISGSDFDRALKEWDREEIRVEDED